LKSPETSSAYREKLNEYLVRHVDDINEAWALLKMPSSKQLAQYWTE